MRYNIIVLFLAVQLFGCSHLYIKNYTSYPNSTIEEVYDYCVDRLGEDNSKYVATWWTVFTDDWIMMQMSTDEVAVADGLMQPKLHKITVKVHDCIWDTSLLHEMVHVLQWEKDKVLDFSHRDGYLWEWVRTQEIIMLQKCPKDYKRKVPVEK